MVHFFFPPFRVGARKKKLRNVNFRFVPSLKGVENLEKSVNFRFTPALKGAENMAKVALFSNQFFFISVWIRIRKNQILCGKEHLHRFFQMQRN